MAATTPVSTGTAGLEGQHELSQYEAFKASCKAAFIEKKAPPQQEKTVDWDGKEIGMEIKNQKHELSRFLLARAFDLVTAKIDEAFPETADEEKKQAILKEIAAGGISRLCNPGTKNLTVTVNDVLKGLIKDQGLLQELVKILLEQVVLESYNRYSEFNETLMARAALDKTTLKAEKNGEMSVSYKIETENLPELTAAKEAKAAKEEALPPLRVEAATAIQAYLDETNVEKEAADVNLKTARTTAEQALIDYKTLVDGEKTTADAALADSRKTAEAALTAYNNLVAQEKTDADNAITAARKAAADAIAEYKKITGEDETTTEQQKAEIARVCDTLTPIVTGKSKTVIVPGTYNETWDVTTNGNHLAIALGRFGKLFYGVATEEGEEPDAKTAKLLAAKYAFDKLVSTFKTQITKTADATKIAQSTAALTPIVTGKSKTVIVPGTYNETWDVTTNGKHLEIALSRLGELFYKGVAIEEGEEPNAKTAKLLAAKYAFDKLVSTFKTQITKTADATKTAQSTAALTPIVTGKLKTVNVPGVYNETWDVTTNGKHLEIALSRLGELFYKGVATEEGEEPDSKTAKLLAAKSAFDKLVSTFKIQIEKTTKAAQAKSASGTLLPIVKGSTKTVTIGYDPVDTTKYEGFNRVLSNLKRSLFDGVAAPESSQAQAEESLTKLLEGLHEVSVANENIQATRREVTQREYLASVQGMLEQDPDLRGTISLLITLKRKQNPGIEPSVLLKTDIPMLLHRDIGSFDADGNFLLSSAPDPMAAKGELKEAVQQLDVFRLETGSTTERPAIFLEEANANAAELAKQLAELTGVMGAIRKEIGAGSATEPGTLDTGALPGALVAARQKTAEELRTATSEMALEKGKLATDIKKLHTDLSAAHAIAAAQIEQKDRTIEGLRGELATAQGENQNSAQALVNEKQATENFQGNVQTAYSTYNTAMAGADGVFKGKERQRIKDELKGTLEELITIYPKMVIILRVMISQI